MPLNTYVCESFIGDIRWEIFPIHTADERLRHNAFIFYIFSFGIIPIFAENCAQKQYQNAMCE